jgi:diguanylate cyclase (GGDEF)-like protein
VLDRAEHMLERARRGSTPIAALFIDLDGFKDINDTLGHSIGDRLLQKVAWRMAEHETGNGRFYRLGGDEFVLVQPDCGDPREIAQTVDAMLKRLAEKFDINGHQLFIGASAGIAIAPADGADVEELMSNADLALYDAKSAGGNAYRLFVPVLRAKAHARRGLDAELRRACVNKEFELYYQPQVRADDGAVMGAEALLRWRHPERGILAPGAFIEALSESPVVLEVGRWILQSACEQAAAWRAAGFPALRMGVNLFPAQFHGDALLNDVETALSQSGLPADALEIEITENIALGEQEQSLEALRMLRAKGVKLAFDDFGTGYASLSYLTRYPLTRLKIDQSFVRKIAEKPASEDTAIVRSIIVMAHNLGLEVIAEGVETGAQAAFLRAEKCEELQGYLYAKPLPAADFEAYLRVTGAPALDVMVGALSG